MRAGAFRTRGRWAMEEGVGRCGSGAFGPSFRLAVCAIAYVRATRDATRKADGQPEAGRQTDRQVTRWVRARRVDILRNAGARTKGMATRSMRENDMGGCLRDARYVDGGGRAKGGRHFSTDTSPWADLEQEDARRGWGVAWRMERRHHQAVMMCYIGGHSAHRR